MHISIYLLLLILSSSTFVLADISSCPLNKGDTWVYQEVRIRQYSTDTATIDTVIYTIIDTIRQENSTIIHYSVIDQAKISQQYYDTIQNVANKCYPNGNFGSSFLPAHGLKCIPDSCRNVYYNQDSLSLCKFVGNYTCASIIILQLEHYGLYNESGYPACLAAPPSFIQLISFNNNLFDNKLGTETNRFNTFMPSKHPSIVPSPTNLSFKINMPDNSSPLESLSLFDVNGQLIWYSKVSPIQQQFTLPKAIHRGYYILQAKCKQSAYRISLFRI